MCTLLQNERGNLNYMEIGSPTYMRTLELLSEMESKPKGPYLRKF